ncbi:MAG: hypothetical protein ACRD1E_01595 [Terriglobales bacterium]
MHFRFATTAMLASALVLAATEYIRVLSVASAREIDRAPASRRAILPAPEAAFRSLQGTPPRASPCWLIEYSSPACAACLRQEPLFAAAVGEARRAGCRSVRLSPSAGEAISSEPEVAEAAFVSLNWAERHLRLTLTPTTLAIGRGGRLIWYKVGALTEENLIEINHLHF